MYVWYDKTPFPGQASMQLTSTGWLASTLLAFPGDTNQFISHSPDGRGP